MTNRIFKTATAALFGISGLLFATAGSAAEYSVEINKTEILRLPGQAAAVVIGNPKIADISVHSSDTLLLSGRGYGETNIIVFDEFGQTVMDADIVVNPPRSRSGVRVNRVGAGNETYNCTPYCVPAPVLGDSQAFVTRFEGEVMEGSNIAAGAPTRSSSQPDNTYAPPSYEPDR